MLGSVIKHTGNERHDSRQSFLAAPEEGASARRWRWLWLGLGLPILFLVAVGFLTHLAVEHTLRHVLAKNLEAIINADVTALRIWMKDEKEQAQLWARSDFVREQARNILAVAAQSGGQRGPLLACPAQAEFRKTMTDRTKGAVKHGYWVVDPAGRILAADQDELVGRRLTPEGMRLLGRVNHDGPEIIKPFRPGALIQGMPVQNGEVHMLVATPVRETSGNILASLAFVIDPRDDFTRILSVARLGDTGETYAFTRDAVMISDSRFETELKRLGLLSDTPDAQSILNVRIRDPGGDLARGYKPRRPPADWPLTRMASEATAGKSGMATEGYRNYRGTEVLGIWRWLPEYAFGVATELSLAEALQAVAPLTVAYRVLFAALILTVLGIMLANLVIHRLRGRVREAQRIGRYTLEEKIGEGGMGAVYRARHGLLRRPTAIKLLHRDKVSPETLTRFEREVALTSQLTHPNTIAIFDYGRTPENIFYYAMEYLGGITLTRLIELEGAVGPGRTVHILRQVCASLAEAHTAGLVHRDIKPANIILCRLGGEPDFVKVLDFGLVQELTATEELTVSAACEITGTPIYIAPERLRRPGQIDARCDLYSLGVVGYNLLTGQDPFQGNNALELCQQTLHAPVPRPSAASPHPLPPELDRLIVDCMAKNPDDRPSSARAVIERLDAIVLAEPWDWRSARDWWERNAAAVEVCHWRAPRPDGREVANSAAHGAGKECV